MDEKTYHVTCIRRGEADVRAGSEEAALDIAEKMPIGEFSWTGPEDHQVEN